MKKILFLGLLGIIGVTAQAENYSTLSVSYDNTQLWYGDNRGNDGGLGAIGVDGNKSSLNGFGLQYNYGIGLGSKPMNIEVGLKWNMGFKSASITENYYGDFYENKFSTQFMRLSIPVSYIYHFHVNDMFAIAPYAGLDFRFNLLAKTKWKGYEDGELDYEESWSWFDKAEMGDDVSKRFQMGWHVGVRFEVKKCFLGVEYGTDFMPFWTSKWEGEKSHINTGNLAVSVGYKF